jgi:hypothetical protein
MTEANMKPMLVILVAIVMAAPTLARAQYWGRDSGYTIIKPGEPPTFVNPNFNGGYTAITPGEPPAFINPTIPSAPRMPIFDEAGGDDN